MTHVLNGVVVTHIEGPIWKGGVKYFYVDNDKSAWEIATPDLVFKGTVEKKKEEGWIVINDPNDTPRLHTYVYVDFKSAEEASTLGDKILKIEWE